MIGIIADVLSVVIGGIFGALIGQRLSAKFAEDMNLVFGLCAIGMGIKSIFLMENMPAVILAITLGSILGLTCKLGVIIRKGAEQLQKPIVKLLGPSGGSRMEKDEYMSLIVTMIVLFCASGTGIYGCLDAGMTGNCTILLSKTVLDLFTAMVFACNAGLVVSVVALPQLLVFLILFALAHLIVPLTTPGMIADFKACGGFLLVATGLRIAKIKELPLADMLPAMVLVMPFSQLWTDVIAPLLSL